MKVIGAQQIKRAARYLQLDVIPTIRAIFNWQVRTACGEPARTDGAQQFAFNAFVFAHNVPTEGNYRRGLVVCKAARTVQASGARTKTQHPRAIGGRYIRLGAQRKGAQQARMWRKRRAKASETAHLAPPHKARSTQPHVFGGSIIIAQRNSAWRVLDARVAFALAREPFAPLAQPFHATLRQLAIP